MAKTKAKPAAKTTGTAVPVADKLNDILVQMVKEMEVSSGDDRTDGIRKDCLIKFETTAKYISARWPK